MGNGLPRVILREIDLSQYVDTLIKGVSCIAGITEKGPVGKPQLISSEAQFERVFGGNLKNNDFPLIAKRALSYGAVLWVSRIVHYTDITRLNTITAKAASIEIKDRADTPQATLKISAANPGTWGNNLKIVISASSLEPEHLFTLSVLDDDEEVETLADVSMDDDSEYYIENQKSSYISIEDLASSSGTDKDRPALGTYSLTGGLDGTDGISDADYIGSATNKTGMYAFDEIDDALQLAVPGVTSPSVITAGLAYCENRKDLVYIAATPFNLTPQEAVDFRLGQGVYTHAPFVSNYGAMYLTKLKIYDLVRQKERYIAPEGDILGIMAVNDYQGYESHVPAGARRGRILNALGVDYNVGARGALGVGNYLSENQLNPICVFDDMGTVVWGAQTLQRIASLLRELNVRRMMIVVEKAVAAYARSYLFEKNDPVTWRQFYRGLEPKFREWQALRWFYDFRIECDQDAESLDKAKLNTPESVQRGEFKCKIFVKPVVGIKWVMIDAVITRLDADFAESYADMIGG